MEIIKILGVDCGHCAASIERAIKNLPGVKELDVRLEEKVALVSYDPAIISREELKNRVEDTGYEIG